MQEVLKKKIVLSVVLLALVGISGTIYTFTHAGPSTVNAQTSTLQTQDKETADDNTSVTPSKTIQRNKNETIDTPEKDDKPDVTGQQDNHADGEVQDGN